MSLMEAGWGVSDGEASPNTDSSLAWVFLFMQRVILAHGAVRQNTTQTVKRSQCETYTVKLVMQWWDKGGWWYSVFGSIKVYKFAPPKWNKKERQQVGLSPLAFCMIEYLWRKGSKSDLESAEPGLFILWQEEAQGWLEDADKNIVCSFWGQTDHLNPKPPINLFPAPGYWMSHNLIQVQGPFLGWSQTFSELVLFEDLPMMNCMTRKCTEVWKSLSAAIPWAD